jgi:hypothetical protein
LSGSAFARLAGLVARVDERLRGEVRRDGLARNVVQALDVHVLDVDDAGEPAHAIEEQGQVVVRPLDLDVDRPLRIELLLHEFARRELLQREVALPRQRLDPLDQLLGVALGRKNLQELGELELEPLDLLTELGQLALGRASLGDLLVEAFELGLLVLDLFLERLEVEPVHGAGEQRADEHAHGQGVVPGLLFDVDSENGHG